MKKVNIGWQEWCSFEEIGLKAIKAKVDTGAATSCLHAFNIKTYLIDNKDFVKFQVHPIQGNRKIIKNCIAPLVDTRVVINSGGQKQRRHVIRTQITIGEISYSIEVTLTNRISMRFRMLLGREALSGKFIVDTSKSFLLGKISPSKALELNL